MITARYEQHNDEWAITVAGHGKELNGKAPGIIAARDRADQLVEKLAPEGATPTVVHLLNGSALEFTTAYMTARLARPEQSADEGEDDGGNGPPDADNDTKSAGSAEAVRSAGSTTGKTAPTTPSDKDAKGGKETKGTKPDAAASASKASKPSAGSQAAESETAKAAKSAKSNTEGAHAAGEGKAVIPPASDKPSGRRRKPEPAESAQAEQAQNVQNTKQAGNAEQAQEQAAKRGGVPRKDLGTRPKASDPGAEPAKSNAQAPVLPAADGSGRFAGVALGSPGTSGKPATD